jgi:hypothetical protein
MLRGHLEQPGWQLDARALAQGCSLVDAKCGRRQPRTLTRNPFGVALYKSVSLALRSASWNGDAHAAVMLDAQEVTARAAMTDEVDRCERPVVCRCDASDACRLSSPKPRIGGDGYARIVNERQTELHD